MRICVYTKKSKLSQYIRKKQTAKRTRTVKKARKTETEEQEQEEEES